MRTLSTHVPALVERLLDQLTALRWHLTRIMPGARARRIETMVERLAEQLARHDAASSQEHHATRMCVFRERGVFDHPIGSELLAELWTHIETLPPEVAHVLVTNFGGKAKGDLRPSFVVLDGGAR